MPDPGDHDESVPLFVEHDCEIDPNVFTTWDHQYKMYKTFCSGKGLRIVNIKQFWGILMELVPSIQITDQYVVIDALDSQRVNGIRKKYRGGQARFDFDISSKGKSE